MIFQNTYLGRQKFYQSAEWQKVRIIKLEQNPICEECIKKDQVVAAQAVDHMVSIKHNPFMKLVMSNLRSLCHSCHSKKTANEQGWSKEVIGRLQNAKWKIDVTKFKR